MTSNEMMVLSAIVSGMTSSQFDNDEIIQSLKARGLILGEEATAHGKAKVALFIANTLKMVDDISKEIRIERDFARVMIPDIDVSNLNEVEIKERAEKIDTYGTGVYIANGKIQVLTKIIDLLDK